MAVTAVCGGEYRTTEYIQKSAMFVVMDMKFSKHVDPFSMQLILFPPPLFALHINRIHIEKHHEIKTHTTHKVTAAKQKKKNKNIGHKMQRRKQTKTRIK